MHDLDLLGVDPHPVGHDLGEGRLQALAVRRRARVDAHRAGHVDAHQGGLHQAGLDAEPARARDPGGREAADLGPGGEADAAELAVGGPPALGLRVEVLEQLRQRALVVAGVVDHPDGGLGREVLGRDEVLPPDLEPVHAQLVGELVDHDLDVVGGLGPPGAADRVRGHLVGHHARDVRPDRLPAVAARHHERAQRRDQRRQQHHVRAEVRDDLDVQAGERAVLLGADLDVGDLVAAVVRDGHVLRARLDPLHRPAQLPRRPGEQDLLAVDLQLGAEAAADVGGDHAHAVLGHPELQREEELEEVRHLRGARDGELAGAVVGDHAARLDRRARGAVVDEAALHDDVRVRERRLDVAAQRPLVNLVRAEVVVHERGALERLLRVDDRGQRVVVDEHVLGGVDHRVAVAADDDGDRVADVLHRVLRQRPVDGRGDLDAGRHPGEREAGLEVEVGAGEDGLDAGPRGGGRRVDRGDRGVRLGGAHEGGVQRAAGLDVVDVVALALDAAAGPPCAASGGRRGRWLLAHAPSPPAISWIVCSPAGLMCGSCSSACSVACFAACWTALTMLW